MESPTASPRPSRAAGIGILAAIPVALVYGVLSDPFGLSWGLIIVGLVGGAVIGAAVAAGAWGGRFHLIVPRVRWLAVLIALLAWIGATSFGYVAGQFFYQSATTSLFDRLSLSGLLEYLNGSVFSPSLLGLAAMAFMAWRGAR